MDQQRNPIEKKVFFLTPHYLIKEVVIHLVEAGFEVYIVDDKEDLIELLAIYPNSIVYINFDLGNETEWEEYVKQLFKNEDIENVRIGVLTFYKYKQEKFAELFIRHLGVQCGFICLNLKKDLCIKLLLRILDLNEAKGRRKHVRAMFANETAVFNLQYINSLYMGEIRDISLVGMACFFSGENIELPIHAEFDRIQLIIKGIYCKVTGSITMIRKHQDQECYIFMFNMEKINQRTQLNISKCIYYKIQHDMNKKLAELKNSDG